LKILDNESKSVPACAACRTEGEIPFPFTMAFQPIVQASGVFAYEALVRGPEGQSAGSILSQVNDRNMYAFDQACRVKAIELAASLSPHDLQKVSINFIPGAVYRPEACIRKTLETAARVGMPLTKIIFEVTESEQVADRKHLVSIFREYRKHGLQTAIDDFGAGFAGLGLLAEFQPDIVKLDMAIVRNIDQRAPSRAIVRAIVSLCEELGIRLIAEGIETKAEFDVLLDLGIELFQGYLFAKPRLESFAPALWPNNTQPALRRLTGAVSATEAGILRTI
jgi:EAL domain-containing protein (putative c-di-GMP-specific phosphodiesterase class I)